MAAPQNILTSPVSITVKASTNNENDKGHHHCFEQDNTYILTFDVKTDPSVDTINFVLWNIKNPLKPTVAEPATDWPVDEDGHVTIVVGPDPLRGAMTAPLHLGPGPYCATLTASSSTATEAVTKSVGKVVGNALYYYETRESGKDCKY
jgi:hypothetical protein